MLGQLASIIAWSEKEKDQNIDIFFRTKGGEVEVADTMIRLINGANDKKIYFHFLIEEVCSSAGILILARANRVSAKQNAIFEWHYESNPSLSEEEIVIRAKEKAQYLSLRSRNATKPEVFLELMANKKVLNAEDMKKLGLVHKITP